MLKIKKIIKIFRQILKRLLLIAGKYLKINFKIQWVNNKANNPPAIKILSSIFLIIIGNKKIKNENKAKKKTES